MIVCSCAVICDRAITDAADAVAASGSPLTCGSVYRHLGKRPRCGNCRPLMAKIVAELDARNALCPSTGEVCAAKTLIDARCDDGRKRGLENSGPRTDERIDNREPALAVLSAS